MTTALLTLGRLPKALELVWALRAAGCRVVIADPMGWHLCRVSRRVARSHRVAAPAEDPDRYLEDMAAIVRREGADLIVPVGEEILYAAALAGRTPARFFGMAQDRLLALHDKLRFVETARSLGLAAPDSAPAGSPEAAALIAAGETVLKPRHGCSGIGLMRLTQGASVPPPGPALVQRFVPGRSVSACALTRAGRVLGLAVYRPTVLSSTVAVAFARETEAEAAVADWTARFVAGVEGDGILSFDFIIDEAGAPRAIECNPRPTSGVHLFDPTDLAAAILNPDFAGPARLRPQTMFRQTFPVLTEFWAGIRDPAIRRRCRAALLAGRDVNWDWRDPLPLVTMTATAAPILWRAARAGVSLGEAATRDLVWREPASGSDRAAAS